MVYALWIAVDLASEDHVAEFCDRFAGVQGTTNNVLVEPRALSYELLRAIGHAGPGPRLIIMERFTARDDHATTHRSTEEFARFSAWLRGPAQDSGMVTQIVSRHATDDDDAELALLTQQTPQRPIALGLLQAAPAVDSHCGRLLAAAVGVVKPTCVVVFASGGGDALTFAGVPIVTLKRSLPLGCCMTGPGGRTVTLAAAAGAHVVALQWSPEPGSRGLEIFAAAIALLRDWRDGHGVRDAAVKRRLLILAPSTGNGPDALMAVLCHDDVDAAFVKEAVRVCRSESDVAAALV